MKGVSIMSDQRVFDMELVKVESLENAVRTPFYQTDSTGGSVWVIKPGQILPKHYHHHSDDVFYPTPDTEVTFTKGQVIVSKKGECHGAKNTGTEDVVFVSIVAPVPADYDPVSSN